jgi:hypothetical protein
MKVFDLLVVALLTAQMVSWWQPIVAATTARTTKVSRVLGDDLMAFINDSGQITVKDKGGRDQSSRNVLSGTVVNKVVDKSGRAYIKCFFTDGDKLPDFSGNMKDAPTKLKLKNNQIVSGKVRSCDAGGITLSEWAEESVPHTMTSTRWSWAEVEKVSSPHWAYIYAVCPERIAGSPWPMNVKVIFAGCGDIYKSADVKVELTNEKGESAELITRLVDPEIVAQVNRKTLVTGQFVWTDPSLKRENAFFTSTKACDSADSIKANFVVPAGTISAEDLATLGEFTPQKKRESSVKIGVKPEDLKPPGDPKDAEIKKPPTPLKGSPKDPNDVERKKPKPQVVVLPKDSIGVPGYVPFVHDEVKTHTFLSGSGLLGTGYLSSFPWGEKDVEEGKKPKPPLQDSLLPKNSYVPKTGTPPEDKVPTGGFVHNDGCPPPYYGPDDTGEGKKPKPPLQDSQLPKNSYVPKIGTPPEDKVPTGGFVHNDGCPPPYYGPDDTEEGKKPKPPLQDSLLPKNSYVPKTGTPDDPTPPIEPLDPNQPNAGKFDVTSVILEVPISYLVDGTEPVIGGWTTASLRKGELIEGKVEKEKSDPRKTELLSSATPGSEYSFKPLNKYACAIDDGNSVVSQVYYFTNGSVAGFTNKFSGVTHWYTPDGTPPAPEVLSNPPKSPVANPALPLELAQKAGLCDVSIRSNNNPNYCEVVISNVAQGAFTVQIAEKVCFLSSDSSAAQNLMEATDPVTTVAAGKTEVLPIETYCISTKSIKPPPAAGLKYTVGKYPDPQVYKMLVGIAQQAQRLNKEGRFDNVPVAPARRANKIAQTAIWMHLGKQSGRKSECITPDSLKDDLLDSGKDSQKKLTAEQMQKVRQFAQLILSAAELTLAETNKSLAK